MRLIGRIKRRLKRQNSKTLAVLLLFGFSLPGAAWALLIERGVAAPDTVTAQAWTPAPADIPADLQVTPLTKKPKAGEPVDIEVRVAIRAGAYAEGPAYTQPWGDWAVTKLQAGTPLAQGGRQVRTDRLSLLTYRDGKVELPGLVLRFRAADGRAGEYRSAPLVIDVQAAAVPDGNLLALLRDLKAPMGFFPWLWVLLTLALAAALAAGAWTYARHRRWIGPLIPAAPPRPPADVARERLAALRASGWLAAGDGKAYYSELSDILRRYLEGRFGVAALDRTTQELTRELKAADFARGDVMLVREILEHADMAKFAKAQPAAQESDADWQAVSGLVERTAPAPAPAAAEEARA